MNKATYISRDFVKLTLLNYDCVLKVVEIDEESNQEVIKHYKVDSRVYTHYLSPGEDIYFSLDKEGYIQRILRLCK